MSEDGIVVGEVRSDEEALGRPGTRPAAFYPDGEVQVLLNFPASFGSRAIDRTAEGMVLVLASVGPSDTRAILWDLKAGDWRYVGDPTTEVSPLAITAAGAVLGQGRNAEDQGISFLCPHGGSWQRLGTADGMWPVDISDDGDVVGYCQIEGLVRPWLYRVDGELLWLPYVRDHHTQPTAISNLGQILGNASADHGTHVLLWEPAG